MGRLDNRRLSSATSASALRHLETDFGEYDIYTIPADGGEETQLTTAIGLDDGPDYSPDGKFIYFNSVRTGLMQIWRMNTDGSDQQQITSDDYNNWFPHPSPDGKWIVFLSYEKDVKEHPPNKDVMLRLMPTDMGEIQVLAKLFGGQGTINVPSWSPDSRHVAFVSYRLINARRDRMYINDSIEIVEAPISADDYLRLVEDVGWKR
ncbi:TolB family protein, partial [Candidatus Poribacteria bacterium]|nr:TolB family protein [Candidatus Poribacteria bacterium]